MSLDVATEPVELFNLTRGIPDTTAKLSKPKSLSKPAFTFRKLRKLMCQSSVFTLLPGKNPRHRTRSANGLSLIYACFILLTTSYFKRVWLSL